MSIPYGIHHRETIERNMTQKHFWNVFCLLILTLLSGCGGALVDNGAKFHFTGRVIDQKSEMGIRRVELFFIDTGMDYVRSLKKKAFPVGQSDASGNFVLLFNYGWGVELSSSDEKSNETFTLEFQHPDYESLRMPIRMADYPSQGFDVHVDVGIVRLKKIDQIPRER